MPDTTADLTLLFQPRSIAIIGASQDESKSGEAEQLDVPEYDPPWQ